MHEHFSIDTCSGYYTEGDRYGKVIREQALKADDLLSTSIYWVFSGRYRIKCKLLLLDNLESG